MSTILNINRPSLLQNSDTISYVTFYFWYFFNYCNTIFRCTYINPKCYQSTVGRVIVKQALPIKLWHYTSAWCYCGMLKRKKFKRIQARQSVMLPQDPHLLSLEMSVIHWENEDIVRMPAGPEPRARQQRATSKKCHNYSTSIFNRTWMRTGFPFLPMPHSKCSPVAHLYVLNHHNRIIRCQR